MNQIPNRRARRAQLKAYGLLRAKEATSFFSPQRQEWYKKAREEGNRIHEMNEKANMDAIENQLQTILDKMKETWTELGYNEEEIALLEESWTLTVFKSKETFREDKKRSRELSKQANQLRSARK